jgi:hypothetical protein
MSAGSGVADVDAQVDWTAGLAVVSWAGAAAETRRRARRAFMLRFLRRTNSARCGEYIFPPEFADVDPR